MKNEEWGILMTNDQWWMIKFWRVWFFSPDLIEVKENVVRQKSYDFALRIVEAYKTLAKDRKEFVLSKQMLRSGTSIGANIEEADASISKAEFSAKISIAYKEAR